MSWDLYMTENKGDGGDILFNGKDLVVVNGIENQPYLAMCGGNLKENGQPKKWWGDILISPDEPSVQLNSEFESTLDEVALNSLGRQLIENAIKTDLTFLKDLATTIVDVVITSDDRIEIKLQVLQNDGTTNIIIVEFKKATDGDFYFFDWNDDFLV